MGNGDCGQFIPCCFFDSFLPWGFDSLNSSPFPMWGSSHRLEFSMNFFSVGPSWAAVLHELLQHWSLRQGQSFRAPAWVPQGSQVLPPNLLQCGHGQWQVLLELADCVSVGCGGALETPATKTRPHKPHTLCVLSGGLSSLCQ